MSTPAERTGAGQGNSADRVRAYLTARTAYYAEICSDLPESIAAIHDWETGRNVPLWEADLEALLQTVQILSGLLCREPITSGEQLHALPVGTVLMDNFQDVYRKYHADTYYGIEQSVPRGPHHAERIFLPAQILYTPAPEQEKEANT